MRLVLLPLVHGMFLPGEEEYQDWEVQGEDWDSDWRPQRIPKHMQKNDLQPSNNRVVETESDEIMKNRISNIYTKHVEDFALENIILNHSFNR